MGGCFTARLRPVYPEDAVYVFGGQRRDQDVVLVSGTGIELWHGPWGNEPHSAMDTALNGSRLVIGTVDSIGVNQIAVRDATLIQPPL